MNKKAKSLIKLKWVIVIVSLILVYSCQNKEDKNTSENNNTIAPVKVVVQKVTTNASSNKLTYNGNIIPKTTTPLSFLLPGTVISIKAEEGDWVEKGQILAELNNTSYKNAYRGTLATQKQAQDAYNRLKTVYDKGSLPEIRWEDVKTKLEQANSANQIALQNLANSTLKAPSNGYIGMRNLEIGETTIPGVPVFNLVAINEVYIKVSVPENEINKIKKDQQASVNIPALGSQLFTGKVEKIGVVANPISKTYDVKISIPNQLMTIKPGMACDISINISSINNIIAVPYQSVIKGDNGQNYVYIVDVQSKTVVKTAVKLGSFINNKIEIVSGISIGDLIVTEGKQKLSNKVKITF
jgi:RND family efflux transporter MFP subunit